ncbi:hypothetical protein EMUCRT_0627 [Ehrlichia cf. muris str. EmCRT]|uniref:Uncharacterized protein n=1 Tax=Ehrlichia cf. muris str. EmCRT TaxID=1359167 RepID=A0A0F3ND56_9RICK|nr:hypothetical protein EMUCRT_0627 [Ehrlichia cf. muris str. EmCRT]
MKVLKYVSIVRAVNKKLQLIKHSFNEYMCLYMVVSIYIFLLFIKDIVNVNDVLLKA